MIATQASLDALAGATRTRCGRIGDRIDKTFRALRRENADITISSVARRAGLTRNSITAANTSWHERARTDRWSR